MGAGQTAMNIFIRIILDLIIFFAVLHGWWVVVVPLGLIGTWKYTWFVELIIAGIAYDSLFGLVPEMGFFGYAGIICSSIIFILVFSIKRVLRR